MSISSTFPGVTFPGGTFPGGTSPGGTAPGWTGPVPERSSLEMTDAPDVADQTQLLGLLSAATEAVAGPAGWRRLAVLLRNDTGTVTGGLLGVTAYRWLQVMALFVPEPLRGRGVGAGLVSLAEAEAVARGCVGVQVDGFDFQVAGFYERLGFTAFGVQENHPPGHRRLYLAKRLEPGGHPHGSPAPARR